MKLFSFEEALSIVVAFQVASNTLTGNTLNPNLVGDPNGIVEIRGTIIDTDGNPHTMRDIYIDLDTASKVSLAMGIPLQ